MKKLLVFLSIFAILFVSTIRPLQAEQVDNSTTTDGYQVNSVFSDISYSYVNSATSVRYLDNVSLGGSYFIRSGVSSYTHSVSYYGASLNNYLSTTFSHVLDTSLPQPVNPLANTTISCTQSYSSSGLLIFSLDNFYFNPNLNDRYYGFLSFLDDNISSIGYILNYSHIQSNNVIDYNSIDGTYTYDNSLSIRDFLYDKLMFNSIPYVNKNIFIDNLTFFIDVIDSYAELEFEFLTELSFYNHLSSYNFTNPLYERLRLEYSKQINIEVNDISFDWLTQSLSGFLNFELFPNFSFSSVIGIVFGLVFLMIILKVFFGG